MLFLGHTFYATIGRLSKSNTTPTIEYDFHISLYMLVIGLIAQVELSLKVWVFQFPT